MRAVNRPLAKGALQNTMSLVDSLLRTPRFLSGGQVIAREADACLGEIIVSDH